MRDDLPHLRRNSRYDGVPPETDTERAARQKSMNSAPLERVFEPAPSAAADPDPVLVSQLVRRGGMTEAEAIEALSKGPSNAV